MNSRSVDLPDSFGPQTTISSCSASASTCQPASPPKPSMRQPSTLIGPAPRASRRRSRHRGRRAARAGTRPARRGRWAPAAMADGAISASTCSSKRALWIRSRAAPSTCGWPSCSDHVDRRRDTLVADLDVEDLQALAQRQGQVVGRLGTAQLGVERRAALQADAQDPVLARQHPVLAGEIFEPALAVLDQAARVVDLVQVVEHQLLPAHGRQRPELDVGPVGAELDVQRALRARLAEVPALQAARVPRRRLARDADRGVHVPERPVVVCRGPRGRRPCTARSGRARPRSRAPGSARARSPARRP